MFQLNQDETYVIEIFTVDENEKFSALLYSVPSLEIPNDLPEGEKSDDTKLRGSMLKHWVNPNNEMKKIIRCSGVHLSQGASYRQVEKTTCCRNEKNRDPFGEKSLFFSDRYICSRLLIDR